MRKTRRPFAKARLKRGLVPKLEIELVRGGLLDNKGCNNAGQAGTDRANNGDLGT